MLVATLARGWTADDVPAFAAAAAAGTALDVDLTDADPFASAVLATLPPCGATRLTVRGTGGADAAIAGLLRCMQRVDHLAVADCEHGLGDAAICALARCPPAGLHIMAGGHNALAGMYPVGKPLRGLRRLVLDTGAKLPNAFIERLPPTLEHLALRDCSLSLVALAQRPMPCLRRLELRGCTSINKCVDDPGSPHSDCLDMSEWPALEYVCIDGSKICPCTHHMLLSQAVTEFSAHKVAMCGGGVLAISRALRRLRLGGGGVAVRWPRELPELFGYMTQLEAFELRGAHMRANLQHDVFWNIACQERLRVLDLSGSTIHNADAMYFILDRCPVEQLSLANARAKSFDSVRILWNCPTLRHADLSCMQPGATSDFLANFQLQAPNLRSLTCSSGLSWGFLHIRDGSRLERLRLVATEITADYAIHLANAPGLAVSSAAYVVASSGAYRCDLCRKACRLPRRVFLETFIRRRRIATAIMGCADRSERLPAEMLLPALTAAFGFPERCAAHAPK